MTSARRPVRSDLTCLSRVRRVTGTILVALVLATAVFSAQEPGRAGSEGTWLVNCAPHTCDVVLKVVGGDPSHLVGFIYQPERNVFLAVGLPAPTRATVSVDRQPPYDLAMCTGRACLLRGPMATSLLRDMQHGQILRLEFHGTGRMAGVAQVSLSGFKRQHAEALEHLREDP